MFNCLSSATCHLEEVALKSECVPLVMSGTFDGEK